MTTTKKLKLVPFDKDGSLIASTFAAKLMESRGLPVYWRSPSPFLARLTFIPTNILSDGKRRFMISSHELMKLIPMMEKGTVSGESVSWGYPMGGGEWNRFVKKAKKIYPRLVSDEISASIK